MSLKKKEKTRNWKYTYGTIYEANERESNFVNFIEITDKKWRKKD